MSKFLDLNLYDYYPTTVSNKIFNEEKIKCNGCDVQLNICEITSSKLTNNQVCNDCYISHLEKLEDAEEAKWVKTPYEDNTGLGIGS